MASIGHVAVGMAAGRLFGGERGSAASRATALRMLALSAASLLPDLDVIAFAFGVPYGAPFGHRGASHSIAFAIGIGVVAAMVAIARDEGRSREDARARSAKLGLVVALVVMTHGMLDAMTDGGRGVALLWPFSTRRIFFPWRPIPVAPIGLAHLFASEAFRFEVVAFAPLLLYALVPRFWRTKKKEKKEG